MQDPFGRPLELPRPARRIVSLVPSTTALLADLGLEAEVVGLTRFCTYPAGWKARKEVVGGTKDLRPERIAALAPDLILANREENVREQVEPLCELAPVHLSEVRTLADNARLIAEVGALAGREAAAAALQQELAAGFAACAAALGGRPPRRALYLIWREPYMSVGGDTFIHAVLSAGGFTNVCGARTRYPSLEPAELAGLAPEVILLSSEPYPFGPAHQAELAALVPSARVELVDGVPFSWHGSRVADAPAYLRALQARLD